MELPHFPYHPDPTATGSFEPSETVCVSCGQSTGYIYVGPVYAVGEYSDMICPWCISNDSAAAKFGATFSDCYGLDGLESKIVEEITRRTPGYNSWQSEKWLTHCNDACEYHGNPSRSELRSMRDDLREQLSSELELDADEWQDFVASYEPAGDPSIYKFVCRHCSALLYDWDCS